MRHLKLLATVFLIGLTAVNLCSAVRMSKDNPEIVPTVSTLQPFDYVINIHVNTDASSLAQILAESVVFGGSVKPVSEVPPLRVTLELLGSFCSSDTEVALLVCKQTQKRHIVKVGDVLDDRLRVIRVTKDVVYMQDEITSQTLEISMPQSVF